MSTKTTLKRIALVAVSALGFGVLTSVAPASAAQITSTAVTIGASGPARPGVVTYVPVTLTHADSTEGTDTFTVAVTLTSKPTGSTATDVVDIVDSTSAESATLANGTVSAVSAGSTVVTTTVRIEQGLSSSTTITSTRFWVALKPDVAGTYSLLVSEGNSTYTAGNKNASVSIATVGAPATISMTAVNSTFGLGTDGSAIKVVLKDANGAVTKPDANESILLSLSGSSTATFKASSALTQSLGESAFATGTAVVNVLDSTADKAILVTAKGDGMLSAAITNTLTVTSGKAATSAGSSADWQANDGSSTVGWKANGSTGFYVSTGTASQTWSLSALDANGTAGEATATATKYALVKVTDTTGAITGVAGTAYDVVLTQAGGGATKSSTLSITAALGTSGSYQITGTTPSVAAHTITTEAPAATTIGAISPATINAATGATMTFVSKVTDQFGVAFANATVVASQTSGRNSAKAAVNMISDASGYVSYTLTDTGSTGTTDTVDFRFSGNSGSAKQASVLYGLATVKTVTLTGGNTTAGVTSNVVSAFDIAAGTSGPTAGAKTFTATIKDANGALLVGVPVTWTVAGEGVAITSTSKTGYTLSDGTDSASVYAWKAGTYTVTATAGGVSGTGTITFAQTGAGEERAISAAASGNIVTATVVDRFGNPVPGVTVYATKTGAGYFGSGLTRTSTTTGSDGTADFVVAGGDAVVTVSTLNWTAVAGTCPSGQTGAAAGNVDCTEDPADATAFTATAAGTALVDEKGVGASFSAKGVSSATVSVTDATTNSAAAAADAAAEAIDAANAATDAANLAAEAADAATVAAEEARDAADAATAAVEELATQVATLMAALKAQITTLANTVAKIAKKVRA